VPGENVNWQLEGNSGGVRATGLPTGRPFAFTQQRDGMFTDVSEQAGVGAARKVTA